MTATPVTVIGGYLGAGKTTLINEMLRQADGLRIAVLVNEFGALAIDKDLIVAEEGDIISIAGGCICCAFGDDLVGAFSELLGRSPRPEHIVIEASGVAIPASIAATLSLVSGVSLAGIVVLADAETVRARARDTYMGDTILRQIAGADLILATKSDLVEPDALEEVQSWLRSTSDGAEVIPTVHGSAPNAVTLGAFPQSASALPHALEDHGTLYESVSFRQISTTAADDLMQALSDSTLGIVRAKGFFRDKTGATVELHSVGARMSAAVADGPKQHHLVCIGLKGQMHGDLIARRLASLGFRACRDT